MYINIYIHMYNIYTFFYMPPYEIFPLPPWPVVALYVHTYVFVFACFHVLHPYEIFPVPPLWLVVPPPNRWGGDGETEDGTIYTNQRKRCILEGYLRLAVFLVNVTALGWDLLRVVSICGLGIRSHDLFQDCMAQSRYDALSFFGTSSISSNNTLLFVTLFQIIQVQYCRL